MKYHDPIQLKAKTAICKACGKIKEIKCFHTHKNAAGKVYYVRTCTQCYQETRRDTIYLKRFGMSLAQVRTMYGSVCGICGTEPKRLCLDHDHKTGKVRGRLCDRCNRAIGMFQDVPELLDSAAAYLRKSTES